MDAKLYPQDKTDMGEIRVRVLLTNSLDEALNRRKKLKKSAVRRYEADALVDTGAVRSVIPAHVLKKKRGRRNGVRSLFSVNRAFDWADS